MREGEEKVRLGEEMRERNGVRGGGEVRRWGPEGEEVR